MRHSHVTAHPGNIQGDSEGKIVQSQETEEHEGQECRESDASCEHYHPSTEFPE
jgi:hypothetical protein